MSQFNTYLPSIDISGTTYYVLSGNYTYDFETAVLKFNDITGEYSINTMDLIHLAIGSDLLCDDELTIHIKR